MHSKTLIAFSLIALQLKLSEACSCFPTHPQTLFCRADYAALIVPYERRDLNASEQGFLNIEYSVRVEKVYKANQNSVELLRSGKIYTASNDGLCGVNFELNVPHIIAGVAGDGQLAIHLCDLITVPMLTSPFLQRALERIFRCACDCTICIERKFGPVSECPAVPDSCNATYSHLYCYELYSACSRTSSGVCTWMNLPELDACLGSSK